MFIICELIYNQTYEPLYGFEMITILHIVQVEWYTRKTIVCMHGWELKYYISSCNNSICVKSQTQYVKKDQCIIIFKVLKFVDQIFALLFYQ